jgi:peptide/nickel transport system substrate-binding protein
VKTSADGKTLSVTLRGGATFHDGTKVTATDVKYTLDRIKKINIGVASFLTAYASSSVTDPTHLTITLKAPYAPFTSALTRAYIVNSKLVSAHAGTDSGQGWLAKHDAGSGPYMLKSATPNQAINFTQYSKYWGGFSGQPKDATIQIINTATQRSALLNGSIDVAMNIDPNDWSSFSSNSEFTVDKADTYEMLYVFFKMKDSPVSNKLLREAIASAYNYPQHIQDILKGAGKLAHGVMPSAMTCYDGGVSQPTYDPTRAKALLAQSGLKNVSVTMSYLSTEGEMVKAATLLQSNLKAVGITLKLKAVTYPQYVEETKSNKTTPDLGMIYAFPPFPDPSSIMYQIFDSRFINSGQNWGGYDNPQVDKLVEQAQETTDPSKRCPMYSEAEKLILADTPTINMSSPQFVTVYNKRITGFKYEPAHNYVVDFYRTRVS